MQRFQRRCGRPVNLALGLLLTEGTADLAGAASTGVATAVTKSAAGAAAIGLGVQSLASEALKYTERRVHRNEQDAIAEAAGNAPVGETRPWQIRHTIPVGNAKGELAVVREYATPLATCREVVFSVEDDGHPSVFTTSLCRQAARWKWAMAEPAVGRWGFLQ